ncbi:MAG TPA: DUF2798 domain-containing protein [Woeseiaceae bacterium]|nr:DUF2798 domain-containing protein [Woeseiaceae bacterium]
MLNIPRRFSHFVYGVIQSGLTCLVAAGITSAPMLNDGGFISHWFVSWLVSWAIMLPVVLLAAPQIRRMTRLLTREEASEPQVGG